MDNFSVHPDSQQLPLVFKFAVKTQAEHFKFTTAASFLTNKDLTSSSMLRLVWRVSFSMDEEARCLLYSSSARHAKS